MVDRWDRFRALVCLFLVVKRVGRVGTMGLTFVGSLWVVPQRMDTRRRCAAIVKMAEGGGGGGRNSASRAQHALIFDCDGVILESESLHREAYNQVFREFNVEYEWTPEYYDELQNKVGGGKPKMRYYFGEYGWPKSKLGPVPDSDEAKVALVDALQDRKTVNTDDREQRTGGIERRVKMSSEPPSLSLPSCVCMCVSHP